MNDVIEDYTNEFDEDSVSLTDHSIFSLPLYVGIFHYISHLMLSQFMCSIKTFAQPPNAELNSIIM